MKKQILCLASLLSALLFLASCGTVAEIGPLAIDEEVDICETCTMMVQDNQFSTQIVPKSGEALKFDDIGCMAMYINDHQVNGQAYVRDFYTKEWVGIEDALFVSTEDVDTPMNHGFLSFANSQNLERYVSESNGKEVTWKNVLETITERSSNDENQSTDN